MMASVVECTVDRAVICCLSDRGRHLMGEGEGRDESLSATSSTWDFGEPTQKNPCFCGK